MSVGLLTITHSNIGRELLNTAAHLLGKAPLKNDSLTVCLDCDTEGVYNYAREMVDTLDSGDGVLILTDIFGATPFNIAKRLHAPGKTCLLTGINLPMILRIYNYPDLDLKGLTDKALDGGKIGVICCPDCD